MKAIQKFTILPNIPEQLNPLMEIAYNLWWTWNPLATSLFQRLDRDLWEQTGHNPIKMLGSVSQETFHRLLSDTGFLSHMDRVSNNLKKYMEYTTWYDKVHGAGLGSQIAYFSLEFGFHESVPIYSGGLGVLAGDHLKSTSELGLPMTGIGLCYRHGYFRQYLNRDGWQQEDYVVNDIFNMPLTPVLDGDGKEIIIDLQYPNSIVRAKAWKLQVGRVPLYLLDTNIEHNRPEDRKITSKLYGGNLEMRIRQELLLGIGGMRLLQKLNINPTVCHMNEGHSAFLGLERIRQLKTEQGLSLKEAHEIVFASNVFTTHTPVPAGNDIFPSDLMEKYFKNYVHELGISMQDFLRMGRQNPRNNSEPFCMTVLALKLAASCNGVSQLHGEVSRKMWNSIWPGLPEKEVPIFHITNGIHTQSWYSDEIARLLDRYVGPEWLADPVNQGVWQRIDKIPDAEIWRCRDRLRERLVGFAREKLRAQLKQRGHHQNKINSASEVLDPEVLTIGFARRFATYKRANLILDNLERLEKLLNHAERPVQIIFAGKAHPNDHPGKEMIRQLIHITNRDEFRNRVVFLENYNIAIARAMIQGVDVWMNTPRRPMEASGTSGMKAAVNGALNLSILDGWWCEGYTCYNGHNTGWAIGSGEDYTDHSYQDEVESRTLYDILENEVAPTFYQRTKDGLPRSWIAMLKASMQTICPMFNTNRMVEEYTERFYLPAILQWNWLEANQWQEAKKTAVWKDNIRNAWPGVKITGVAKAPERYYHVKDQVPIKAVAQLNGLSPSDVAMELCFGPLSPEEEIIDSNAEPMTFSHTTSEGHAVFTGNIPFAQTGHHGFSIRILPYSRTLSNKFETGLLTWISEPYRHLDYDHPELTPQNSELQTKQT